MGILQGDSPTPGPAMYWQPFHHGDQQRNMAALADAKSPSLTETSAGVSSGAFQHPHQFESGQLKDESLTSPEPMMTSAPPDQPEKHAAPVSSGVYCAGCGQAIADRFYLVAVDRTWHSECLRCSECHSALDTAHSCFARQSRIYCKDDYYRLFGTKQCAKCGLVLAADELVMRARDHFYHTRCFSCHVCGVHLTKGSTFGMMATLIFCRDHYPGDQSAAADYGTRPASPLLHQSAFGSPFHPHPFHPHHYHLPYLPSADYATCTPNHFGAQSAAPTIGQESVAAASGQPNPQYKNRIRKRRPNKEMQPVTDRDDDSSGGYLMDDAALSAPQQPQQQQKTKRLRTSFKHHQLRMLKSYFATNHNPDAKDLKQLSQKTTLSKRVLQVWFQNARAKWRRMMQKQEAGAGGAGLDHAAASPTSSAYAGHQPHHLVDEGNLMTSSRSSMYDDLSFSGSSSASVGFPSPM